MIRPLRACAAGLTLLLGAAGQESSAPVVARPERFERVLWCGDAKAGPPLALRLGCTAVQLPRGADPAPLLQQGLGYYLDQPIGKGLLELRDEQWQPVAAAYERTRDPAVLLRPSCFAAPGVVAAAAAAAAAEVARVRGPGLRFVALADEASATRHDAPLDTCQCEHCRAAFQEFARVRYPDIAALNSACGTQFADFAAVAPVSTDAIRRRELGDRLLPADLRAWSLHRDFVDAQFAAAVRAIAAAAQQAAPEIPVGLTGLSAPAPFGGQDPARLLPTLSLLEPYDIGGAPALSHAFGRADAHHYATLLPPEPAQLGPVSLGAFVRASLVALSARGAAGVVVWNDATVAEPSGELAPFGRAVQAALQQYGPQLDACAGARVEPASLWLVESQPSVRAWWMIDSAADGMTWVRRLASYEREHSSSQAARSGWLSLLADLGVPPRVVGVDALAERLLQEKPRVVVLPALLALSDRAAQALTVYVQAGGTLIADHSPAFYDEQLLRREAPALDGLFGVQQRSLAMEDLWVRGGAATARDAGLPLAEAGLRGALDGGPVRTLAERREHGDAFLERQVGRGRTVYLNAPVLAYGRWRLDEGAIAPARELRRRVRAALARAGLNEVCEVRGQGLPTCIERTPLTLRDGRSVLVVRLNALAAPAVLQRLAATAPLEVTVVFPTERTLRHLGGEPIGRQAVFELELDPFAALWLEVVE